jgi:hypothetical protein
VLRVAEDHVALGELPAALDEDLSRAVDQDLGDVILAEQISDRSITQEFVHHAVEDVRDLMMVGGIGLVPDPFIDQLLETNPHIGFAHLSHVVGVEDGQEPATQVKVVGPPALNLISRKASESRMAGFGSMDPPGE